VNEETPAHWGAVAPTTNNQTNQLQDLNNQTNQLQDLNNQTNQLQDLNTSL
jgi:hypothetical protein